MPLVNVPKCTHMRKTWKECPTSSPFAHFIPHCKNIFVYVCTYILSHEFKDRCKLPVRNGSSLRHQLFQTTERSSLFWSLESIIKGENIVINLGQLRGLFRSTPHPPFPGPLAAGGLDLLCFSFVIHFLCLNYISLFHSAQMFERCLTSGIPHPIATHSFLCVVVRGSEVNCIFFDSTNYSCTVQIMASREQHISVGFGLILISWEHERVSLWLSLCIFS